MGYEGYGRYGTAGQTFEANEEALRRDYEKQNAKLAWSEARPASYAAWSRFNQGKSSQDVDTYGNPRRT